MNPSTGPFTPAGPAREHVRALMRHGIGGHRIATLTGISDWALSHLLHGRPDRGQPPPAVIPARAARAILAITPDPANLAGGALVDATGTRRRIQALVACGWSRTALAVRLGLGSPPHLLRTLRTPGLSVTAGLDHRARALYDELWDQRPPETTPGERRAAARSRNHAARHGWAPPLAWCDDEIDDPAARPHEWRRTRTTWRSVDLAAEAADVQRMDGCTRTQAAERLGVSRKRLEKAAGRAAHAGRERAA